MYMSKARGLNIDESYACNRTAVRKAFECQDISVLWGNNREFSFDSRINKKSLPNIDGIVVASLTINHNTKDPTQNCVLAFYIISDAQYGLQQKRTFETGCLPRLAQWLQAHQEPGLISGCDELLVAWNGRAFLFYEFHFA